MCDMIWFLHHRASISIECSRHDLHRASGSGAKTMDATMMKLQVSTIVIRLTIATISHHEPHCKTKLDASTFLSFCNFYVSSRAFAIRTVSYLRTTSHNIDSVISFYYPLKEAFACIVISTRVGETTPAKPHLYGTSRMSSVEPVSHKSMRKVGRRQLIIQQYRG